MAQLILLSSDLIATARAALWQALLSMVFAAPHQSHSTFLTDKLPVLLMSRLDPSFILGLIFQR